MKIRLTAEERLALLKASADATLETLEIPRIYEAIKGKREEDESEFVKLLNELDEKEGAPDGD